MIALERAEKKLQEIGYSESQIEELKKYEMENVVDELLTKYSETASDDDFQTMDKKSEDMSTPQDAEAFLLEIAQKVFGEGYQEKIEALLTEKLLADADATLAIREKIQKYQQGDPATVEEFQKAANDPKTQEEIAQMKAEGFDPEQEFVKQAQQSNQP